MPTDLRHSTTDAKPPTKQPRAKRSYIRRILKLITWTFLALILATLIARPFLPRAVRWYVNRTLDQSLLYEGKVGDVTLHLWRGAYSIEDVRILKRVGNVPVPFFAAKRLELAVQWNALMHGKLVGQVLIARPEVNFVDDPIPAASQTGSGGPWLKMISDLFPFDINSVDIQNGSIHFRTYQKAKPVDVYLSELKATVDDLTNVKDSVTPLLTTVQASGLAMDQARFEMKMMLNPFSYNPTFHLAVRLLNLDVTKTNDLMETYGGFNVKRGWFDFVMDVKADEGEMQGYIKPLFRDMVVFDLVQDVKDDNVIQVFWQALVGGVAKVFSNPDRKQFGTLIPFTGELKGPRVDYLATVGNLLRNAFIRAYLPRLENGPSQDDQLQFGAPSLGDPISVGNEP